MAYQFTNGQTFDIDEIESYFIDVTDKVNSQNYDSMVSGGLWSESGISIGSSTEMIKFRYYSPDHVLLEQENVPIVMDGNGVKTHTVYTALSNTTTKPAESSFSTSVKSVSSSNKYLWQYEVTEYTNGTIEGGYSDAKIVGVYGDTGSQGVRGCIYLGCFASNSAAYNSLSLIVNGDYYLNSQDGYIYVYTGSSWGSITDYSDHRYMEAVNDALGQGLVSDSTQKIVQAVNAWTQNLIAGTALINKLFAKEITMQDGGLFKSQNYDGSITETTDSNGNVTSRILQKNGTTGFAMDSHGNMDIVSGRFKNCNINSAELTNSQITNSNVCNANIYGEVEFPGISVWQLDNDKALTGTGRTVVLDNPSNAIILFESLFTSSADKVYSDITTSRIFVKMVAADNKYLISTLTSCNLIQRKETDDSIIYSIGNYSVSGGFRDVLKLDKTDTSVIGGTPKYIGGSTYSSIIKMFLIQNKITLDAGITDVAGSLCAKEGYHFYSYSAITSKYQLYRIAILLGASNRPMMCVVLYNSSYYLGIICRDGNTFPEQYQIKFGSATETLKSTDTESSSTGITELYL